jgi:copper ion binding protein
MSELTIKVPDISCGHSVSSVSNAVGEVNGVSEVRVDLEGKKVDVIGENLEAGAIAEAIREAGYEPEQS